jgi:hypothetical protein
MSHTPAPWYSDGIEIWKGEDVRVCEVVTRAKPADYVEGVSKANAAYIVRAVNAHEDMLSALKELKAVLELSEATVVFGAQYKVVCDAIAKAEGL